MHLVRVWDLPTRCFHWALVLTFAALIATGEWGSDAMVWHVWLGYAMLCLLLFRGVWGVVGGHWSRFGVFVRSPAAVWRYVKAKTSGTEAQALGHNPLGAYSVLAFLIVLTVQVCSGLISDDEITAAGPLAKFVSAKWVSWASFVHAEVNKVLLIVLVALHVAALLFYRWKGQREMIPAMWNGNQTTSVPRISSRDDAGSRSLAVACALVSAVAVGTAVYLAG